MSGQGTNGNGMSGRGMSAAGPVLALLFVGSGCFMDLESFAHSALPCAKVTAETCAEGDQFHQICVPCADPYPWDRAFDWVPGTASRVIPDLAVQNLRVITRDGQGELDVYFIRGHGEDIDTAGYTIFYHHGNYKNLEGYLARLRILYEAGYSILTWDYRGYGKTLPESVPTLAEMFSDAEQITDLGDSLGIDLDKVLYYGFSLGALPAVHSTLYLRPAGLILEAPWTSIELMALRSTGASLPGSFLATSDSDNEAKLRQFDGPTLVMVGDEDTTYTAAECRLLYEAAAGPKRFWEVPGAAHGVGQGVVEAAGNQAYFAELEGFIHDLVE